MSGTKRAAPKIEIKINVYDLLPPGKLASVLWAFGSSVLHTGVVVNNQEYAYGGHDRPGVTGVYWTKPGIEPPGSRFKCEIAHGTSRRSEAEINAIVREASQRFDGSSYNVLKRNCNHFTSYLCERLTGRKAPRWLNRAARVGTALPCIVPREWLMPPDHETAEGELVGSGDGDEGGEGAPMIDNQEGAPEDEDGKPVQTASTQLVAPAQKSVSRETTPLTEDAPS